MDGDTTVWKDTIVQQPYRTPVEGEYLPPSRPSTAGRLRGAGAVLAALGLLLAKFKGLLFLLLNLKFFVVGLKLLPSLLGFVISLWLYTQFFGFAFALVFLLQILVHEFGHVFMMRAYGIPSSMPFFLPGFGAFVNMRGRPASATHEAYIALAGPVAGGAAATLCFLYGTATGHDFWIAAAYTGFFINLFNLIPVTPLDGGRVMGAVSPRIWLFGLVLLVVFAVAFHWTSPFFILILIVIGLLSIPHIIAAWRGTLDPRYYQINPAQRFTVALAYFAMVGYLTAAMLASHIKVGG